MRDFQEYRASVLAPSDLHHLSIKLSRAEDISNKQSSKLTSTGNLYLGPLEKVSIKILSSKRLKSPVII